MKIHIVRSGDTLNEIAKKYNLPVEQITKANPNVKTGQPLSQGSKIFIPTGKISLSKGTEKVDPESYKDERTRPIERTESVREKESSSFHHEEERLNPPRFPVQPEAYISEKFPPPPMFPPAPALPADCWNHPYRFGPFHSYPPMGQVSSIPFMPCYFAYPYSYPYPSYDQGFLETDNLEATYGSSSVYHEFYHQSEWDDYWEEKESSSIEG